MSAAPMITGTVGFEGVPAAFEALNDAENHTKIVVDPRRTGEDGQLQALHEPIAPPIN